MQSKDMQYFVKRAMGRDPDAFAKLIQLCTKDMYKVAIAILMNDEDAADAMQDAILACWEKIDTLQKAKYFKTWMTRILIHKCYDIRSHRAKVTSLAEYEECETKEVYGTDSYELEWKEALSLLDEKYRLVILLFYAQGYRTSEIAEILHIPKSTVQTRLKRARDKMADYYREAGGHLA